MPITVRRGTRPGLQSRTLAPRPLAAPSRVPPSRNQNVIRSTASTVRFPLLEVMVPKPAAPTEFTVVFGPLQIGWLSQLNMSTWNRMLTRSPTGKLLKNDESQVCEEGPRRSGDVRDVVPKV